VRDAEDVANALERLHFKVSRLQDADAAEMSKAVLEFAKLADDARMIVVFYAGHGIEANGENWLIPIDAKLATEADAPTQAVSLRSIGLQVAKARQLGLVILDACRDNPFTQPLTQAAVAPPTASDGRTTHTRSVRKGLAPTEPAANVLVAFAAKDGTVAGDGRGRNSPFTAALLANVEIQGLEISSLFRKVRDEVIRETKNDQQPYAYGSLSSDAIYFKSPDAKAVKSFDGVWDTKVVCDPVAQQLGRSNRFVGTVKDGTFAGQTGREGINIIRHDGTLDADGTIRIAGLTGDPRKTIGNLPAGSPVFFRATGRLQNSNGKAIRTSGRKCLFDFAKQKLDSPPSTANQKPI
jgi:hypothetical protein